MGQFSDSEAYSTRAMEGSTRETDFVALGQPGSEAFAGIETFPNPGVSHVELTSDELNAVCPITGQPDMYIATIEFWPGPLCIESFTAENASIATAASIWRPLARSQDAIATDGLAFLRALYAS